MLEVQGRNMYLGSILYLTKDIGYENDPAKFLNCLVLNLLGASTRPARSVSTCLIFRYSLNNN